MRRPPANLYGFARLDIHKVWDVLRLCVLGEKQKMRVVWNDSGEIVTFFAEGVILPLFDVC